MAINQQHASKVVEKKNIELLMLNKPHNFDRSNMQQLKPLRRSLM